LAWQPTSTAVTAATTAPKPARLRVLWWLQGYDKMFAEVTPRFRSEFGIDVEYIGVPNNEDILAKAQQLFAANEQLDVIAVPQAYRAAWADAGLILPVDDQGEVGSYKQTAATAAAGMQYKGKTWGLPLDSSPMVNLFNPELHAKAGLKEPPKTWDEFVDQALKAKQDGIAQYPVMWVTRTGADRLPFVFDSLIASRGGVLFDNNLKPQLGSGSVARETLRWWQRTYQEWKIADASAIGQGYIPVAQALGAAPGKTMFHPQTFYYFMRYANDPALSPNPGKFAIFPQPNSGVGAVQVGLCSMFSTTASKPWAWQLMQSLAGKDSAGKFTGPTLQARAVGTTGWLPQSLEDDQVKSSFGVWLGTSGVERLLSQLSKGIDFSSVDPSLDTPWAAKWSDALGVQVQNCLAGKINADDACEALTKTATTLAG
jgi:multiple sugar transport system substrate-binding protein